MWTREFSCLARYRPWRWAIPNLKFNIQETYEGLRCCAEGTLECGGSMPSWNNAEDKDKRGGWNLRSLQPAQQAIVRLVRANPDPVKIVSKAPGNGSMAPPNGDCPDPTFRLKFE
jgi:hypothetical protein